MAQAAELRGFDTAKKVRCPWRCQVDGLSRTDILRLAKIRDGMLGRCYRTTEMHYPRYGGRGISVCDEWRASSLAFYQWAAANGYAARKEIDRVDCNGDYTPSNCRFVTRQQNTFNRRTMSDTASRFKGVHANRWRGKPWRAAITKNGRRTHLGLFETEEEAARRYDAAAIEQFGEFAHLNFPEAARG